MATLASAVTIRCPLCGAEAVVRVWSCGCQEVVTSGHRSFLISPEIRRRVPFPISGENCDNDYFKGFERSCGAEGDRRTHSTVPTTAAPGRRPFA